MPAGTPSEQPRRRPERSTSQNLRPSTIRGHVEHPPAVQPDPAAPHARVPTQPATNRQASGAGDAVSRRDVDEGAAPKSGASGDTEPVIPT